MHAYNNPTSFCEACDGDGDINGCCDDFSNTNNCRRDDICDNHFMFCWRALGTRADARSAGCQSEIRETTADVENVDTFIFSTDVLGLSNPIIYHRLGPWVVSQQNQYVFILQ